MQKIDAPLAQATTPSLEALKSYSLGRHSDYAAAVPLFQQAIRLDPNFATAYASLGVSYYALGESSLAAENVRKAYDLRERTSERERLAIESSYHMYVTGNLRRRGKYANFGRKPIREITHQQTILASSIPFWDSLSLSSRRPMRASV